ncbi:MAG: tetratricopeptide repeat protein [Kiritimatiellae bacterium]|nr:tetratricopeptide repeat protein [Kiritimatiellia bacterium]
MLYLQVDVTRFDFYEEPPRKRWEVLITAGVALAVFGVLALWSWPLPHPAVWEDLAIAAGLRPPETPFPGIYRGILALLLRSLPAQHVLTALPYLAHAFLSLSAMLLYLVFRDVMPGALRLKAHMGPLGSRISRLVALVMVPLFLSADPIWRAGQTFSPTTVALGLVVAAIYLFFIFIRRGSLAALYGSTALLGILSAETTAGFALSLVAATVVVLAVGWASDPDVPLVNPLVDGLVRDFTFKRLTYTWMLAFGGVVAFNSWQFVAMGGMEAMEYQGVLGLLFAYFKGGWEATRDAATAPGWLFAVLLSAVPFLLAVKLLPRAWDDDKFLPYVVGVLFAVLGLVALASLSCTPALWYWTWLRDRPMMPCDLLLALFLMLDVAAAVLALAVFGIDACCRNYRRIAQQQFPESMQFELPRQMVDSLARARVWRKRVFWALLALVPLATLPGRCLSQQRAMMSVMADYAEETLAELGDRSILFTDGSYDCLLEVMALARGRRLNALSLLSPLNARTQIIRQRAAEDEEDKALLENDAAGVLRTWVSATPEKLKNAGVQIGFEMWKRSHLPMPPFSGVMALPGEDIAKDELARALAACKTLGDTAYAVADDKKVEACTDRLVKHFYSFVLWRLSRLAQMRSQVADKSGDKAQAYREAAKADELDSVNASVQKMKRDMEWLRRQSSAGTLTPREGLVVGLSRADFAFAGRYAAPVLRTDPDDVRANFAMGMMYYNEEKYSRAEEHLLRCLNRRPDEPAVHNNLANVQMKLGKLNEAEEHVRRALARLPDSDEVKRTLERVLRLKEEKKAKEGTK